MPGRKLEVDSGGVGGQRERLQRARGGERRGHPDHRRRRHVDGDYTGEAPMSGQLDGTPVAGTRSGRQVLRIKASGGHLDVISIESSTEKSSISVGDVVREVTPRAPRAAGIPYTCDRSTLMVFGDTYRRSSAPSRYGEAGCLPRRIESGAGVESSEPLAKG